MPTLRKNSCARYLAPALLALAWALSPASAFPPPPETPPAARWPQITKPLEIPPSQTPALGNSDFTLTLWLKADDTGDLPTGDLLSRYDPATRRGFHLTLKSSTGVTSSQPNRRHLQFGIDDNHASPWRDCGQPGKALLAFALATHAGHLYAGTCEPGPGQSGRVYRYQSDGNWADCGTPDGSNAVTALAEFQGKLYAGTGRYRLAGSSLPESPNQTIGGRIFRYEGGTTWTDCGKLPDTEAVGGLVTFQGRLHASSLYRPAGFFRLETDGKWTNLPVPTGMDSAGKPEPKRPVALAVHGGQLFAGSYDGGHVYRWDGTTWTDLGRLGDNTQTYSFASHQGRLHVGTWPSGRVYRMDGENPKQPTWSDLGRLGDELEVMGMLVHNGRLIAGTLPLAEVYSHEGGSTWKKLARLDHTPAVKYRRAWTMAEHAGAVYCSTLPSGKVWSWSAGRQVTWDHPFPSGWHHVAAIRTRDRLRLFVDGKPVAETKDPAIAGWNLDPTTPLRLGTGENGPFHGQMREVQIHTMALSESDLAGLSVVRPRD
jgi:hypothetical protein